MIGTNLHAHSLLHALLILPIFTFTPKTFAQLEPENPNYIKNAALTLSHFYLFSTAFQTAPSSQYVGAYSPLGTQRHFPTKWGYEFGYSVQAQEINQEHRLAFDNFGVSSSAIPRYLDLHRLYFTFGFSQISQWTLGSTFNVKEKLFGFGIEHQRRVLRFGPLTTSVRGSGTYAYSPLYFTSYFTQVMLLQSFDLKHIELCLSYNLNYGRLSFHSNINEQSFKNLTYNGLTSDDHNFVAGIRIPLPLKHTNLSFFRHYGVEEYYFIQLSIRKATQRMLEVER